MSNLEPLQTLFELDRGGEPLPLPPDLVAFYGPLRFPPHPGRPYLVGNFVTSLDGVAAVGTPGDEGGELPASLDRRVLPGEVRVLILTTTGCSRRLQGLGLPPSVQVAATEGLGRLSARSIIDAVGRAQSSDVILVEGGPHRLGDFLAEGLLDELFLTLAPQVAGPDGGAARPGLVAGWIFAPEHPLWATLVGVKRGGSHLFLRYAFCTKG